MLKKKKYFFENYYLLPCNHWKHSACGLLTLSRLKPPTLPKTPDKPFDAFIPGQTLTRAKYGTWAFIAPIYGDSIFNSEDTSP